MKRIRTILILFVVLILLAMCFLWILIIKERSNVSQNPNPKLGYAGHIKYYHDGSKVTGRTTFEVNSILFPFNQYTIKTTGFSNNAKISLFVNCADENGDNSQVIIGTTTIIGNQEIKNFKTEANKLVTGTYTLEFSIYKNGLATDESAQGTIEVWIY